MREPLLGTDVGGIPEIIEDGKNGCLVPPENEKKIADALNVMLNDRERLNKMGKYGRFLATERFSWHQVAENTLAVYEQVLRNR